MVSFTPNRGYSLPTVGGDSGAWGGEANSSFSIMDSNMGASVTVAFTNINVTASAAQYECLIQNLTGTLTANVEYILPSLGGFWIIENNTTGAFTMTVITASSGASILAPQGQRIFIYSDGTNIFSVGLSQFEGVANVSVAGGTNVTATPTNYPFVVQNLTGVLTANINYVLPAIAGRWTVANNTTGAFALTLTSAGGGASIALLQTQTMDVYSDGTNIYQATSGFGNIGVYAQTGSNLIQFYASNGTTNVGNITTNGTTTTYGTSSDQRLKEHCGKIANVGTIIDRLRPRMFRWKAHPAQEPEPGFFAQEVAKVWPWAVLQPVKHKHDPMKEPWQIDATRLIPLMVAEIQELRQRMAAMERGCDND